MRTKRYVHVAAVFALSMQIWSSANAQDKTLENGKANEQNPTKIFQKLVGEKALPENKFQQVNAVIELDRVQKVTEGIAFSVTMTNNNEQAIEFINPLEFQMVFLTNKTGQRLRLSCSEARWANESRVWPKPQTLNVSFEIVRVALGDKVLTAQEIETRTFNLPQASSLRFDLKLSKAEKLRDASDTIKSADSHFCVPLSKVENLVPGHYKLYVGLNLFPREKGQKGRAFGSDALDVELSDLNK